VQQRRIHVNLISRVFNFNYLKIARDNNSTQTRIIQRKKDLRSSASSRVPPSCLGLSLSLSLSLSPVFFFSRLISDEIRQPERILIESSIAETSNSETPHSCETISSPSEKSIEDSADRAVFVLYIHVEENGKES